MDIVTIDSGEMALITEQIYGYLSAMDKAHLTLYPAEWYEENGCTCFKLVGCGFVAGVACVTRDGELASLMVSPLNQGRGNGRVLVDYAVEKLGARFLFCFEDLIPYYASTGVGFSVTHFIKWDEEMAPKTWDFFTYPGGMDLVFMSLDARPYPWPLSLGRVYSNFDLARSTVAKTAQPNVLTSISSQRNGRDCTVHISKVSDGQYEVASFNGQRCKAKLFSNLEEATKYATEYANL